MKNAIRRTATGVLEIPTVASLVLLSLIVWNVGFNTLPGYAAPLSAGVAKVDITDRQAGPVNDPLYVKALVIKSDKTTTVLIMVDAVAIGEIGPIKNDFLPKVRSQLERELGILPSHVLVNASHCHGRVCAGVDERTVEAVKKAAENRVPVKVGAGVGTRNASWRTGDSS